MLSRKIVATCDTKCGDESSRDVKLIVELDRFNVIMLVYRILGGVSVLYGFVPKTTAVLHFFFTYKSIIIHPLY